MERCVAPQIASWQLFQRLLSSPNSLGVNNTFKNASASLGDRKAKIASVSSTIQAPLLQNHPVQLYRCINTKMTWASREGQGAYFGQASSFCRRPFVAVRPKIEIFEDWYDGDGSHV